MRYPILPFLFHELFNFSTLSEVLLKLINNSAQFAGNAEQQKIFIYFNNTCLVIHKICQKSRKWYFKLRLSTYLEYCFVTCIVLSYLVSVIATSIRYIFFHMYLNSFSEYYATCFFTAQTTS